MTKATGPSPGMVRRQALRERTTTMITGRDTWRTLELQDLFEAILRLATSEEAEAFFRDLCTIGELHDMAQRWAVVRMLEAGKHYAEISRETGASTATITRINSWLQHGEGGYRLMLDRIASEYPIRRDIYPTRDE